MAADGEIDTIKSFQRGLDLIDVSAWGVTSLDQLGFRTTSPNAVRDFITFGDEGLAVGVIVDGERVEGTAFLDSDFIFA